jgi:hypothetical protein
VRPYLSSTLQEPPTPPACTRLALPPHPEPTLNPPTPSEPPAEPRQPATLRTGSTPASRDPSVGIGAKVRMPLSSPRLSYPHFPKNRHRLLCSHACLRTYYRVLTSRRGCTGNPNHSAVSRTSVSTISWRMHFRATFKLPTTYPRLTRIPVAEQQDSVKEVLPHGPIVEQHENRDQPSQIPFP